MAAMFVLQKGSTGKFRFNLVAPDGRPPWRPQARAAASPTVVAFLVAFEELDRFQAGVEGRAIPKVTASSRYRR
jgi:hypothetical protein